MYIVRRGGDCTWHRGAAQVFTTGCAALNDAAFAEDLAEPEPTQAAFAKRLQL